MTQFSIPLTEWCLLRFEGAKAQTFLQGQLTVNLDKMTSNEISLTAYCNPQGRVIALFYLLNLDQTYYAFMPKSLAATFEHTLNRYATLSRVSIQPMDKMYFWGFDAQTLKHSLSIPLSKSHPGKIQILNHHQFILPCSHDANRYIFVSHTPCHFPLLHDIAHWHLADLEAGIPWLNQDSSHIFLPQELHLIEKNAVHLNKGCYVGQEIISRMHYRSQFKRDLVLLKSNHPVFIAKDIFANDKPVGKIIDVVAVDETSFYFALASLQPESILDSELYTDLIMKHPLEQVRKL